MAASENSEGQYIFMGNQGDLVHSGGEEEVGGHGGQAHLSSKTTVVGTC